MLLTRLKKLRELRGLSLRELAGKSKVPYSAISLLENGKREPRGRTARKLAQALGVEVAELYEQAPVVFEQKNTPAPVTIQPVDDNKTITPGKVRSKKLPPPAPVVSFWLFEKDQAESEPFRLDTHSQAERLQEKLGGRHQARIYEAPSRSEASKQHTQFLIRVARGHDYW